MPYYYNYSNLGSDQMPVYQPQWLKVASDLSSETVSSLSLERTVKDSSHHSPLLPTNALRNVQKSLRVLYPSRGQDWVLHQSHFKPVKGRSQTALFWLENVSFWLRIPDTTRSDDYCHSSNSVVCRGPHCCTTELLMNRVCARGAMMSSLMW